MKNYILMFCLGTTLASQAQQKNLAMPQNIQKAYTNQTRSADGKPGSKYWQNFGRYNINVSVNPPSKRVEGNETITYINRSPKDLNGLAIKLILNIHAPGATRQSAVSEKYLTQGIVIDELKQNNTVTKWEDAVGETTQYVRLTKALKVGDSVLLNFKWHYDLSEKSGREGKLDSTSFFLAYFYPRIAVMDDTHGWDFMPFTDAQEFYNDFNDYEVSVTVPKNFLVWGTGDLLNAAEVLQPAFAEKFTKSLTSDAVINVVTQKDLDAKNITAQNATNTWKWKAKNVSDVAFCISDNYVWDAASVVVDKKTGRRASAQSAYKNTGSGKFINQVKHIQHSLEWYSNNWPGVPYPFPKSTIIQGEADMEYPMMANDSPQEDDVIQRFIAEHEIGHSYFPFYMGINEHRYGFMDEGWTTAFENMIGIADLGKEKADGFFKQFRVASWATNPGDETQIPIITPVNILSGQAMGHNEYGKPALAYLALKDMLGDDVFKKALHGFMDRWKGKHPLPWDMFNSFSNLSGKDLSWYWHNWFFTSNYMDLALEKVTPTATGYALSIKNMGGYAVPTNVMVEYADGTKESLHQTAGIWEKNQQNATVNITTKKKITFIKLDGGIFMEANTKDNTWGKKAEVAKSAVNLDKYTGVYASKQIPIKVTFKKEDDALVAEAEGQEKLTLNNSEKDTFSFDAAGLKFIFDTAKNEMTLKQGGGEFLFTKEK
jgi:Peptidase family M1 domain